jgi:hypothetical protein
VGVGTVTQREECPLTGTPHINIMGIHPKRCANHNIETQKTLKKQENMTPPKVCNSSLTEFNNTEMVETLDKEFRSIVLKNINDLKEDSS